MKIIASTYALGIFIFTFCMFSLLDNAEPIRFDDGMETPVSYSENGPYELIVSTIPEKISSYASWINGHLAVGFLALSTLIAMCRLFLVSSVFLSLLENLALFLLVSTLIFLAFSLGKKEEIQLLLGALYSISASFVCVAFFPGARKFRRIKFHLEKLIFRQ